MHVTLTSELEWNPYDQRLAEDEFAIRQSLQSIPIQGDYGVYSLTRGSAVNMDRRLDALCTFSPAYGHPSFLCALGDKVLATLSGVTSSGRGTHIDSAQLARRWRCSLETAKRTIQRTTQRAVRDHTGIVGGRKLRASHYQLRYRRLHCEVYTDTYIGPCRSLLGNTCCQVYATKFQWSRAYPMPVNDGLQASYTLQKLFRKIGFPQAIIPDSALNLTKGKFLHTAQKAQVPIHAIEPYMHNLALAEDAIREALRLHRRIMLARNVPKVLWDCCFVYCCEIRSLMALGHHEQDGDCGTTIIQGYTADISHVAEFGFYDWCWAWSPKESNQEHMQLGRWCGPSWDVGDELCFAILTANGQILHRSSVFPLTQEERNSEEIKEMKRRFTFTLGKELGDRMKGLDPVEIDGFGRPTRETTPEYEAYEDDEKSDDIFEEPPVSEEENPVEFDKYISAKVQFMQGDQLKSGVVKGRKRHLDGHFIGHYHENPILDTSIYEVEFEDGHVEAYHANQIAEAIYASVDNEGNTVYLVKEILDHSRDGSALRGDDGWYEKNGKRIPKRTTKGWKICVEYQDGSTQWVSLYDIKESNPIEMAEYAVANKLVEEPAFRWWVPYTLRKRDRIIKAMGKRFHRKVEKFGLRVPRNMNEALEIDRNTGTSFWTKAIQKEVRAVMPALKVLEENEMVPVASTLIDLLVIFDVKMDLTRKCRICARGDQTEAPTSVTYASVVSRESVRIGFLIAALNDLKMLQADVAGAYLNAPCAERVHTILGPEFGDLCGKTAVIVKALYGLASSGYAWRTYCAGIMRDSLEFRQCRADNDVWMRKAVRANGSAYWEYVFIYTDDVLALSEDPKRILDEMNKHFLLKPDSIDEPKEYLGAQISKYWIAGDPKPKWALSSEKYVKEALRIVKARLEGRDMLLKTKTSAVLPSGYKPELDSTPLLDENDASMYMQFIGILRWIVELGRIDICCEVSMMSSYSAAPRSGQLDAVLHIFAYLASHDRSRIVMDDGYVSHETEPVCEWKEFYPEAKDEIPPDMPEALGNPVQQTVFVDASHAANLITRQSRTGVLIFLNRAPIIWFSKKQNSIETSSFGSEFMALKTGFELLIGLRYKLRMMGIPLDGPAHVKVDNMSVVKNSSVPESTLKKKSNSIAYHFTRSCAAADIGRVSYESTETNIADMLTKTQSGVTRQKLASYVLR